MIFAYFVSYSPVKANDLSYVLFGGMDAGPSNFVSVGAKVALDHVDREGFAALFSAGGGVRQELGRPRPGRPTPRIMRATALDAAVVGYQFFTDWGVVALFAGPEISLDVLFDERVRTLPAHVGLRLHGEVWARPSEKTLATATLILGSARWDAYARVSAGYRLWGTYLGPEASLYGDRTHYRKLGLGLHATDFSLYGVGLRVSGGCLYESETERVSPYLGLAAWVAFP